MRHESGLVVIAEAPSRRVSGRSKRASYQTPRRRKLTREQEAAIRALAGDRTLRELGAEFGVSHEAIRAVLRRTRAVEVGCLEPPDAWRDWQRYPTCPRLNDVDSVNGGAAGVRGEAAPKDWERDGVAMKISANARGKRGKATSGSDHLAPGPTEVSGRPPRQGRDACPA